MKKRKIKTIEDLGILVQQEFLTVNEKLKGLKGEVQQEFLTVNEKLKDLKNEILEIKSDIDDIKLRMGEMAFRFEIQDIEKRLKKLEAKAGFR